MRIIIDTEEQVLDIENRHEYRRVHLYSREAFEIISEQWLKVSWNEKYSYTFTWLGRPIIQLPEDMIRIQEVIYRIKPDVIIETGIAHGGSLIYYASLCRALNNGRVIGVDIEIRHHNRQAIEGHALSSLITMIEGNSIDPAVTGLIKTMIQPGESVLVVLDSSHSKAHVSGELEAYHELVTAGSYIIAADGIIEELSDLPRGDKQWNWNNPAEAAREFVKRHPDFVLEPPSWIFNESNLKKPLSYWPGAWLRRKGNHA